MKVINTYDLKVSNPETFKQLATRDLLYVSYKCPQMDKVVNLLTHLNEIVFTLEGKKILHRGDKKWLMSKHKSIFVRKTAYTQELFPIMDGWEKWEVLAFYFPDDFIKKVYHEYRAHLPSQNLPPVPREPIISINVSETTRAFFYGLLPYFSQKVPPSENLLELKFKELVYNVLSDPENAGLLAYVKSLEGQQKPPIWEAMEHNFMYNLSIPQFAQLTGRSLSVFKRDFKAYYHTTPSRWLTQKRLEHARLLLETSNKSVSEVAFECGFENLSHLSRIFKEKYGVAPSQYRQHSD